MDLTNQLYSMRVRWDMLPTSEYMRPLIVDMLPLHANMRPVTGFMRPSRLFMGPNLKYMLPVTSLAVFDESKLGYVP